MNARRWTWVGATSVGTSHLRNGAQGQDAAGCRELAAAEGPVLVGVVSDGAGSASQGRRGARIACRRLLGSFADHFAAGGDLAGLDHRVLLAWLDEIHTHIAVAAVRTGHQPSDFAATLVAVVAAENETLVLHVGDGSAVIREVGSPEWRVPSWPAHGEYVETTFFITDAPRPDLRIARISAAIDAFAIFTDGLERILLDFKEGRPRGRFFDFVIAPLAGSSATGRDRILSHHLGRYLDGPAICERTDDDKTLLLALRRDARLREAST